MINPPNELGSPEDLIKRCQKAKQNKTPWETHLSQCYRYAIPNRETFYNYSPGQKKNTDIFDSTAVIGVQRFASRLQATLIPPWRRWSTLAPGSEIPERDREGVQKELDKVTRIMFDHINHSNFATQSHEALLDLSVSTGVLTCEHTDNPDTMLDFNAIPLSDVYPEEGPNGVIETMWREHTMPARNVMRLWPDADVSPKLAKTIRDNADEKVTLIEGTVHAPKAGDYHNVVLEGDEKRLIFTQRFEVSPWIAFRESVVPGEVLGRGRVMNILPDILTANKTVELVLRNAALSVAGVYTGTDDGVINPYTMKVAPGVVIPVRSNDNSNPSLRALERSGDFSVAELVLEDIRGRINKALFAEPFGGMDQPVKSATEMALRGQELVQDSGATFGRLETEFVERTIKRTVHVLQQAGKLPDIRVNGKEVTIKHTSPLARAQDQEDLLSLNQWLTTNSQLGPETLMMGVKIEDIPNYTGELLGIPQKLRRNEGERGQITDMVAQIIAQSQMQGSPENV